MHEKNYIGLIPENKTGVVIDSADATGLENEEQAKAFFDIAKERLLNVNNWHQITGVLSAKFQLIDKEGHEVNRKVQKGDYFKIDIPGPGSEAGQGYDWVCVEDLKEVAGQQVDSVGLRVRPASNPFSKDESIAHFYSEDSTSTFIVTREGNNVSATIYDRNTKPNTDSEGILDKIRHVAAGIGAIMGLSKIQWKGLADALVKK